MYRYCTAFLAFLCAAAAAIAQPGRTIISFPYNQSFAFAAVGTTAFPTTDVDGGEFTPDAGTSATWSSGTAPGIQTGGGKLRLQTTSSGVTQEQGIIWYGDYTGKNVDSLTLAWNKVTSAGPDNRVNELRIATNGGSGNTFTDIPGVTWPRFDNSNTVQGGTLRVKLPISMHNAADVRIRIYSVHLDLAGTSGNAAKIEIDDLKITSRCLGPAAAAVDSVASAGMKTFWLYWTPGARTDSVLIVRREGGATTGSPANGTRYTVGHGFNGTDTVVYWGPAAAGRAFFSKMKSGTTYHFALYGHSTCSDEYSPAVRTNGATLSLCADYPATVTRLSTPVIGTTDVTVDFHAGSRTDTVLILRRLNAPPGYSPVAGTRYTVGQVVGLTSVVAYFGPPTGSVRLTGLQSDSTYMLAYYGFQTCNGRYTQTGTLDTVRTVCEGRPLNISDISVRNTSSVSASFQITFAGFADHYVVFHDGGDKLFPTLTAGRSLEVGDIIGDDTVKYYGTDRKPTIAGLASSTTHKFYAFGVRECNMSYSQQGDSVSARTRASCGPVTALSNPQSFTVVKNVKDTLQLRWNKVVGADSFLVVARIDSTPASRPVSGGFYERNDAVGDGFAMIIVKDTTATLLNLSPNIAYFVRVHAFRSCDLEYSSGSTVVALATAGTATSQRFVIRAGSLPTITFAGASIKFTNAPVADGSLLVTRGSEHPGGKGLPFFRANDKPINVLSADRWWSLRAVGLDTFRYDLKLDISRLPGLTDTSDLEVLYRPHPDSLWMDIVTTGYQKQDSTLFMTSNNRYFFGDHAIGANTTRNVLPVNLVSFDGYWHDDRTVLNWKTAGEIQNVGFRVYRAPMHGDEPAGPFALTGDYSTHSELRGAGTSTAPRAYAFIDEGATATGVTGYLYRLEEVSVDGMIEEIGRVAVETNRSAGRLRFGLEEISPNPASGSTITLRYVATQPGPVAVSLFDALGRNVGTLLEEANTAVGAHSVVVAVGELPAGVYYCRMTAGEQVSVRTIVLAR